ncbi:MAG: hypothetical protein PWR04_767 [Anaerophaga sp.]|jgi:hypothetical protein|nr:hypothetical protein [Anaerophaga sp.]
MYIFNSSYSNVDDYLLRKGFQLSNNQINEHGVRFYQFYNDQAKNVIIVVDFQEKTQGVRIYTNNLNWFDPLFSGHIFQNSLGRFLVILSSKDSPHPEFVLLVA